MNKPEIDWSEIFAAIEDARRASTDAQTFLARLERHDLTILPLQVRRDADLFGAAAVAKTQLGYAAVDPTRFLLVETPKEEGVG